MPHAYPSDLAAFVHARLGDPPADHPTLASLFSAAYQASLLREEDRPLTFRLLLAPPPGPEGERDQHVRLELDVPRPLDEQEIRRLAPAARMRRAMLGVGVGPEGALRIWGVVETGALWLDAIRGARVRGAPLPPELSVAVTGPGRLLVSRGGTTIAKLAGGRLTGASPDVFDSQWLPAACADPRRELFAAHASRRAKGAPEPDAELVRRLDQQLVRRIIASVRTAHHGGTLVLLPHEQAESTAAAGRPIALKYRFTSQEPRRRYRSLQLRLLDALARDATARGRPVTWNAYTASDDAEVLAIDGELLELAHTIANLADVDGVVLVSTRFEVMGFGGEIIGDLGDVPLVQRALDLEGDATEPEPADGVGTRHRSLYRLVATMPDALGIVVSQDGGVRLVANRRGAVTYWDQLGTGPLEI